MCCGESWRRRACFLAGTSEGSPRRRVHPAAASAPGPAPGTCHAAGLSARINSIPTSLPHPPGLSALLAYYKRKFWDAAVDGPAGQVARPLSDRLVAAAAVSAREWAGSGCGAERDGRMHKHAGASGRRGVAGASGDEGRWLPASWLSPLRHLCLWEVRITLPLPPPREACVPVGLPCADPCPLRVWASPPGAPLDMQLA